MKKKLSIAVVIPVFNEENMLARCLDGIASQTTLPDEIIVVDNNSTDNSVAVAKRYDFVTVIKEKRQGIVYARNAGFDAVKSDIIARIDADTIAPENWIALLLEHFRSQPDTAVTGAGIFYDLPMPWLVSRLHYFIYYSLNKWIVGMYVLWGSNMAFPAKKWSEIKENIIYDNAIAEDIDVSFAMEDIYPIVATRHIITYNSARGTKGGLIGLWNQYIKCWPLSVRRKGSLAELKAWLVASTLYLIALPYSLSFDLQKIMQIIVSGSVSRLKTIYHRSINLL